MYIEKGWLVPTALGLLLLGALFAVALLLLGSRLPQLSVSVRPAEIASVEPDSKPVRPVAAQAPGSDPPPSLIATAPVAPPAPPAPVVPATQIVPATRVEPPAPPAPLVADGQPATSAPEEVFDIATVGWESTQITTRGFGDVGMQFQTSSSTRR